MASISKFPLNILVFNSKKFFHLQVLAPNALHRRCAKSKPSRTNRSQAGATNALTNLRACTFVAVTTLFWCNPMHQRCVQIFDLQGGCYGNKGATQRGFVRACTYLPCPKGAFGARRFVTAFGARQGKRVTNRRFVRQLHQQCKD